MADIFVSYAKADRSLASKLVAMLEAEGWKVWWDTGLAIGDDFRNEIMTEVGRARAVIVIWTDASIKSDWVCSEAGRGQGKLIPVKLPHLTYKDLPPPFDVLQTENLGEDDKIKAAVVAQLAKPAVEPTAWGLLTKGFRYELLTWVGIIGGALTLFTNLSAVLKLADWAQVLVDHWKEWTHAFWVWAFGWLGIHVPPEWTPVLSFLLFGSLLTIGQAVKFRTTIKTPPIVDRYQVRSFQLISWRMLLCLVVTLIAVGLWSTHYENLSEYLLVPIHNLIVRKSFDWSGEPPPMAVSLLLYSQYLKMAILVLPLIAFLMILAKARLQASVTIFFMVIFWAIITGFTSTVTEVLLPEEPEAGDLVRFLGGTLSYAFNTNFGAVKSITLFFVGYTMIFVLLLI